MSHIWISRALPCFANSDHLRFADPVAVPCIVLAERLAFFHWHHFSADYDAIFLDGFEV